MGLALVMLGGCASTPPGKSLDMSKLTEKKFVLSEISMMVRKDVDKDGIGAKFVQAQRDGLLKAIRSAAQSKDVEVDASAFSQALDNGSLAMKKENVDVSADFQLYFYHWTIETASAQYAQLTVSMAMTDKGLPATVSFLQTDPKVPGKPFSSSVDITLPIVAAK
jgi:hypothetical protein